MHSNVTIDTYEPVAYTAFRGASQNDYKLHLNSLKNSHLILAVRMLGRKLWKTESSEQNFNVEHHTMWVKGIDPLLKVSNT